MIGHHAIGVAIVLAGLVFLFYTYAGYPLILWVLGFFRQRPGGEQADPPEWPLVSLSVPAYNEEEQIEGLIRSLLALDYPQDRLQILILSDASTDRTDDIVRSFAGDGVELLRMSERGGKTRAENAAAARLRGEIIVNTDASIRLASGALRHLVAALRDPEVGVASGRDVSVGATGSHSNVGESGYVGYEMAVRDLETRVWGIVGASGSLYAIRRELHSIPIPESLSRDFASALVARERGYRAVSVPEAVCVVPRTGSLKSEFRRKVRTITRGMDTLTFHSSILNPLRYGLFSWMLISHKLCRWALPWVALLVFLALGLLSPHHSWAMALFVGGLVLLALALAGWAFPERFPVPRILAVPAFLVAGNLAAMIALIHLLRGDASCSWEPTRRKIAEESPGSS